MSGMRRVHTPPRLLDQIWMRCLPCLRLKARKSQLPAIPLLFSVLGGMQAFGFVGLVIGPLVFSLMMSIIDIYKRSFRIAPSTSEIA